MKKIILIIGILTLLVSCDMPNNDSSNTDVSNQTDTTSETTNKEDDSSESKKETEEGNTSENEEIEEDTTSETTNKEDETPSSTEDAESEETNHSNEFIVSSDVTWEEIDGNVDSDYVSYVHYNNNDDYTQRITYDVWRGESDEFLFLEIEGLTVNPNTSSWEIMTDLSIYFMENDELKFISSNSSILIENVYINKENKEVHIYLIDKN